MTSTWFNSDPEILVSVAISAVVILGWAIVVIRITGLRSLSKMSSFDFVVTVALGSIVGGVVATSASLIHGAVGFAALLATQWVVAQLRRRASFGGVFDNEPLQLMDGPVVLEDNMRKARVTHDDLLEKLREANVTSRDDVLAVVLETTGDVSVLHGPGPLDESLLEGVRRG